MNKIIVPKKAIVPFIIMVVLFFTNGFAQSMTDTLLAAFKKIMSMTDFGTSLIQQAFYGAYFLLALPAAIFIRKYSFRSGFLLGIGLFVLGALLFYPSSQTMIYGHFLTSLFILASGLSVLEVSSAPFVFFLGSPETGTQRLNLCVSFIPVGAIAGVLVSKYFILSNLNSAGVSERANMSVEQLDIIRISELEAVMRPYIGIAFFMLLLLVIIYFFKMGKESDLPIDSLKSSVSRLIKNRTYVFGVITQFFYVGAQIGVWSFCIRYVTHHINITEDEASVYYLASQIIFALMRFVFSGLMRFLKPSILLMVSAIFAAVCTLFVIYGSGYTSIYALVGISGFMSLMFPTIYGISIQDVERDKKIAGSGLIMAILGGAILTAAQGYISDISNSINYAYSVPLVCFVIVFLFSIYVIKRERGIDSVNNN